MRLRILNKRRRRALEKRLHEKRPLLLAIKMTAGLTETFHLLAMEMITKDDRKRLLLQRKLKELLRRGYVKRSEMNLGPSKPKELPRKQREMREKVLERRQQKQNSTKAE